MKPILIFLAVLLVACTEAPSEGVVKAAAESCAKVGKSVAISNTSNGYIINCQGETK